MNTMSTYTREARSCPWWLFLIEGIAVLIIGICLLVSPGITTLALVQFLGFYWLIAGVLALVGLFVDDTHWGWKVCSGVLGILAGLVVIRNPIWSAFFVPTLLVILLGIEGLIQGIIRLVQAAHGGGLSAVILGLLSILFGIILLSSPLMAALALPYVLGIFAVIGGICAIVAAFRVRNRSIASYMRARPTPTF